MIDEHPVRVRPGAGEAGRAAGAAGRGHDRRWAMFVQVIEGRVADPEGLRRNEDRWRQELQPGAEGFLGSTSGMTDDGRSFLLARFTSAAAARANSERPEQGQWWAEAEKCFDGPVGFSESEEIDTFLSGGSDDAGFVQLMRGRGDREQLRALDDQLAQHASTFRPDLLGGIRAWFDGNRYLEAIYFTSEADARAGEQKEPPPELASALAEFQDTLGDVEFIDLRDPRLY